MRRSHAMPFGAEVRRRRPVRALVTFSPWGDPGPRRRGTPDGGVGGGLAPPGRTGGARGPPIRVPHRRRPCGAGPGLPVSARRCPPRAPWSTRLAFEWADGDWTGRPWEEAVLYEVHVGTATPQGTYAGLGEARGPEGAWRHRHRAACPSRTFRAGATGAMTAFCPLRPTPRYGTPDDLKRLVDRAHGHG